MKANEYTYHTYRDLIKAVEAVEIEHEKLENMIRKVVMNCSISVFPREPRFINQIEFRKECKKWTGKREERLNEN